VTWLCSVGMRENEARVALKTSSKDVALGPKYDLRSRTTSGGQSYACVSHIGIDKAAELEAALPMVAKLYETPKALCPQLAANKSNTTPPKTHLPF
jgi:hypothetical protein